MKRVFILVLLILTIIPICLSDTVYSKEMEAKAKKGDPFAQAQLGYCYLKGEGTPKDGYNAAKWFEKSYANGYEKSKEYLDKFALPEQRYDYKIIQLAEEGDVDAQYTLGLWLSPTVSKKGTYDYIINDEELAFQWMERAANAGDARAIVELANMYMSSETKKDEKKGFNCYKQGAEMGDKRAHCQLALCYAGGYGVDKNEKEVLSWMSQSANNGYAPAMFELGTMYHQGTCGLPQDIVKAIYWYKKAAKAGSSNAMVNLGYCYENGIGVEKDFWKAIEYYGQSAQLDNETAQNNIQALAPEIGKKFPKYFKTLKAKAQKGDPKSQALIGMFYLSNLPAQYKIDNLNPLEEGSKWILEAAKNGIEDTYYIAGDIYETGSISSINTSSQDIFNPRLSNQKRHIQSIDFPKAKAYYEKCAESEAENSWLAQFRLAKAYYNGEELVGQVDYVKSVKYLNSVIKYLEDRAPICQELKEAYELMGKCYYNGRGVEENQKKGDEYMKKSARLGNTRPFEQNLLNSWAL